MGSTQHPRDATRERRADERSPSGELRVCGERPFHHVRGRPRKEGEAELEPLATLFGALLGRDGVPSGTRRDFVEPSAFGCAERRGGFSPRGGSTGIPLYLRGPFGMRPRCLFRECTGAKRDRSRSSLRGRVERERSAPAFGLEATVTGEPSTFGPTASIGRRSQTRPRLLAFPRRSGRGRRSGLEPRGETSSTETSGRRDSAAASEIVSIQSPWEHRAVRSRKATWPQRTPRWKKALRSTGWKARRGDTRADPRRTARGHASR